MNASPLPPDPAADEQASLWAARLDGSHLTPDDQAALDEWLSADPTHRARLSAYCQLSADLEQRLPSLAFETGASGPARKSSRRRAFSAAFAAAAGVALAVWLGQPSPDFVRQVATASGQLETLALPDGTQIDLFPQTNLRIDLSASQRNVRLSSGEAYFAVSRDPLRPFVIETPAGSVRVTGTAFAVDAATDGTLTVLVAEGSVQVHPGEPAGGPVQLGAGQRFISRGGHQQIDTLATRAVEAALAWRGGQAVVEHAPLAEALARFARYHGRGMVATPDAAGLALGGRYRLDDLDGFLAALEAVLPVSVNRGVNGVIRVERRSTGSP